MPIGLTSLRTQLAIVLPLAAVLRLALAWSEHGIYWPDEIYQLTEPAHRFAFGYGFRAWEFQDGLRSWLVPGALGLIWKPASVLGIDNGLSLMRVARGSFAVLGVATVGAAMVWAFRVRGATASLLTGAVLLASPLALVMSAHTFSECVAGGLVIASATLLASSSQKQQRPAGRIALAASGIAGGLALPIRPQSAPLIIGLMAILASEKRWVDLRRYGVALIAAFVAGGLLDWITWGVPFASMWRYIDFNLIHSGSADFFTSQPAGFYLEHLARAIGPGAILVLVGLVGALWVVPKHVANVVAFVIAHSLIAHKELRFLFPVVPYALAVSAVGMAVVLDALWHSLAPASAPNKRQRSNKRARSRTSKKAPPVPFVWTCGLVAALLALGAVQSTRLDFASVGETRFWDGSTSVWGNLEGFNRLLSEAGSRPETCGVAIAVFGAGQGEVFTGGFSYLHRDVPLASIDGTALADKPVPGFANVILTPNPDTVPRGWSVKRENGGVALLTRPGACGPVPSGYTVDFPRPDE